MESSFASDYANPKLGKLQFLLRHYNGVQSLVPHSAAWVAEMTQDDNT